MVDRLILDFPEVGAWVRARGGGIEEPWYETKRDRATVIRFRGTLTEGRELLTLPGVRRSLIAYWTEGLLEMREADGTVPTRTHTSGTRSPSYNVAQMVWTWASCR